MDVLKIQKELSNPIYIQKISKILVNGGRVEMYAIKDQLKTIEIDRHSIELNIENQA